MQVDGIGQVLQQGDWWKLIYDTCGHEQWFPQTGHRLYAHVDIQAEVRQHYAMCSQCAWRALRGHRG